ncbi:hypothetical protein [Halioglobus maricola]|nr:hypothetical protein [Halioglobus maricola]
MAIGQILLDELQRRWTDMFAALARGDDVAPAAGLRAEGLMEAAVLTGAADEAGIDRMLDAAHKAAKGESLAASLGDNWREFHHFPEIPLYMHRAPVVPSTPD